jgi:hypothetical protein
MDDLSICTHLEHAAVGGHQLERADALLQLHEPVRHTGSLGLIVSSRTIFDDNFLYHLVWVLHEDFREIPPYYPAGFARKTKKGRPKTALV